MYKSHTGSGGCSSGTCRNWRLISWNQGAKGDFGVSNLGNGTNGGFLFSFLNVVALMKNDTETYKDIYLKKEITQYILD